MPQWIRFLERKPNGKVDEALGSDSVLNVRYRQHYREYERALAHAKSLRGVGKRYLGFHYLHGTSLLNAEPFREVMFTEDDLKELEGN